MVPPMGLEPMTHALKVRYSTTELRRIKSKNGDLVYQNVTVIRCYHYILGGSGSLG